MEAAELVLALLEASLTQEQVAARSGVHQTTISKLARGDSKDAMASTYRRLEALHKEVCQKQAQALDAGA